MYLPSTDFDLAAHNSASSPNNVVAASLEQGSTLLIGEYLIGDTEHSALFGHPAIRY